MKNYVNVLWNEIWCVDLNQTDFIKCRWWKVSIFSWNKNDKVHGRISSNPAIGLWMITSRNEFRVSGPVKQGLTSHIGLVTVLVSIFVYSYAIVQINLCQSYLNTSIYRAIHLLETCSAKPLQWFTSQITCLLWKKLKFKCFWSYISTYNKDVQDI